jgi:hypothetical protein
VKEAATRPFQQKDAVRATSLLLPFIDDFSDYTGYPNPALWEDRLGFVNRDFPINPPTLGVVTLDALDAKGQIYAHASSSTFDADTLTSHPIRTDSIFSPTRALSPADSLYFSFYYQPGGGCSEDPCVAWARRGNRPETGDKLMLDFGYATGKVIFSGYLYSPYTVDTMYQEGDSIPNPYLPGTFYFFENIAYAGDVINLPSDSVFSDEVIWNEVWSTQGENLDLWLAENSLTYFKQVLIPITQPEYFRDNFQFRFRNKASLENDDNIAGWSSNVDQWHIDYVRLDINRNAQDLYPNDVAFVMPTSSLLKNYRAMPWNQYTEKELSDVMHNTLSNLSAEEHLVFYNYTVTKNGQPVTTDVQGNNYNVPPYFSNGLYQNEFPANPTVRFTLDPDNRDSALVVVTHLFQMVGGSGDMRHENDTFKLELPFYNYYAYDDGTAEAGYTLVSESSKPDISLAMRFTLYRPDTLRGVRFWFNHTLDDENIAPFSLKVWADNGQGMPGAELYIKEEQLPQHASEFLDFVEYTLEPPLLVSGTFYVGFSQNHGTQLNIGFDQNSDARAHFMYNVSNEWREPYLKGAPMIRPVLGKYYEPIVGIRTPHVQPAITVALYPNPTADLLYLQSSTYPWQVRLLDMSGNLLKTCIVNTPEQSLSLAHLPAGMYLLHLKNKSSVQTLKVVKW